MVDRVFSLSLTSADNANQRLVTWRKRDHSHRLTNASVTPVITAVENKKCVNIETVLVVDGSSAAANGKVTKTANAATNETLRLR